ncbi:hypothetical protein Daus18300_014478 [Diaporthe australafricana]|uniref:Uncharacterized protein n=1 Tax=Diaporthe australafricana TaxID=127596 RepID=A0ABR3VUZ9_9PEZI
MEILGSLEGSKECRQETKKQARRRRGEEEGEDDGDNEANEETDSEQEQEPGEDDETDIYADSNGSAPQQVKLQTPFAIWVHNRIDNQALHNIPTLQYGRQAPKSVDRDGRLHAGARLPIPPPRPRHLLYGRQGRQGHT